MLTLFQGGEECPVQNCKHHHSNEIRQELNRITYGHVDTYGWIMLRYPEESPT